MSVDTLGAAGVGAGAGWLGVGDALCFFRFFFPSLLPPIVRKLLAGLATVTADPTVGNFFPMNDVDCEGTIQFPTAESLWLTGLEPRSSNEAALWSAKAITKNPTVKPRWRHPSCFFLKVQGNVFIA